VTSHVFAHTTHVVTASHVFACVVCSLAGVFFFYLLRLRRYKAKRVKTRCFQEGWVSLSQDFRGKGSSVRNIFLLCF